MLLLLLLLFLIREIIYRNKTFVDYCGIKHDVMSTREYYTAIQSLYRPVVCNISMFCKSHGDRNQPAVGVSRQ